MKANICGGGAVTKKPVYIALAVRVDGKKEVLEPLAEPQFCKSTELSS